MTAVLGINAVFHDPAAALVVDGRIVAAAEEERFSRRKHGKACVPFSTWELPEQAIAWCLRRAGLAPGDLDAIGYSYDPALAPAPDDITADEWEGLRTLYVERAPRFLASLGLDADKVRFVAHHVAHAASAHLAAPFASSAVLVVDGRGERAPRFLDALRELVRPSGDGGFTVAPVRWEAFAPRLTDGEDWTPAHADLACSVQARLEEVLLGLARWLHQQTGEPSLTMAGGVALNCVANSRLWREGPFDAVWVQPASGDSGTALGAALRLARDLGDRVRAMPGADVGRSWDDDELETALRTARVPYEHPRDIAEAVAEVLARDGVVAWFQGASEYGPRALGRRSLLADPRSAANVERLNDVKGREQFRPVAPMVLEQRAAELFDGPLPSPYMLFTHRVRDGWRERIPAVVHVDGTARIQTVSPLREPLVAAMLGAFERRTGVPVVVNTSLNTAGRPMVDDPRDALECFGSSPVDALALGPFLVLRPPFEPRLAEAQRAAA